jgi:hypothetical protein
MAAAGAESGGMFISFDVAALEQVRSELEGRGVTVEDGR